MHCEDAQTRLQEYLDGQLPSLELQAVRTHLAGCAICRQELVLLRQVDSALATMPVLEEPANFTAQVMAQVRTMEPKAPPAPLPVFRLRWEDLVISFAFAGTMVALLFAFSLLQPEHVSTARAFLHRAWWTLLPELDLLWHTMEMEPFYAAWALSSLCVAAAATTSAIVLLRQWSRRPASVS